MFPNGLHIDLKTKKCRMEDLSPLFSVITTKKAPSGAENASLVNDKGKMSHEKIDVTSVKSGENCDLNADEVEAELDRWRDILFTDYSRWLLNNQKAQVEAHIKSKPLILGKTS